MLPLLTCTCASLQEVATQALQASNALKAERKRSLAIEKQVKAANEGKVDAHAAAAKAADERAALIVRAENAAVETRQQCDLQVEQASDIIMIKCD